jgi:hypothetical protein
MTITAEIIEEAFRESNLLNELQNPTPTQFSQALKRLQSIVSKSYGFDIGENFVDWETNQYGSPLTSTLPFANIRIVATDTPVPKIFFPMTPDDGARMALIDPESRLAGTPITFDGNGRTIDGAETYTANTSKLSKVWMYRADLGDWITVTPIDAAGTFPFPEEFNDYFITSLAMRINPVYGASLDPQSQAVLYKSRVQLQARYQQHVFQPSELGLLHMSTNKEHRYSFYNHNKLFTKGWPY